MDSLDLLQAAFSAAWREQRAQQRAAAETERWREARARQARHDGE